MKKYFTIAFISILSFSSLAQSIKDIEVEILQDNKIKITYQFSYTKFNQSYDISLYVSRDGGESFIGPLKQVIGDIGKDIRKGKNKIIWDYLKEVPFIEEELIFDVRADISGDELKKDYFGQYVTALRARFGKIGKTGWYLEAGFDQGGKTIALGLTQQLYWDTYLYLGGGIINLTHTYEKNESLPIAALGLIQRLSFIPGLENVLFSAGLQVMYHSEDLYPNLILGVGLPIHFK
mgnify:CR=1 FL=1